MALVLALVMALSLCTTAFAATYYKISNSSAAFKSEVLECEKATVNWTISYAVSTKYNREDGYSMNSTSLTMYWAVFADGETQATGSGSFKKSGITKKGSYVQSVSVTGLNPDTKYTMYLNTSSAVSASNNVAKCEFETPPHDIATVTDYKAPTCTVAGNEALYQCKNCKTYYKDLAGKNRVMLPGMPGAWKTTLPAQGGQGGGKINATHTLATVTDYKAPTCLEAGNKALYKCSVCSKYFDNKNNEVEASQVASWTSVAGKLDKTDHNWNDWTADQDTRTLSRSCTTASCTDMQSVTLSVKPVSSATDVGSNLSEYIEVTGDTDAVNVTYAKVGKTGSVSGTSKSEFGTTYKATITAKNGTGTKTVSVEFTPKCFHTSTGYFGGLSFDAGGTSTYKSPSVKATCSKCSWTSTATLQWNDAHSAVVLKPVDKTPVDGAEAFWSRFTIQYAKDIKKVSGEDRVYQITGISNTPLDARWAFAIDSTMCSSHPGQICNHHQPILKLDPYFAVTFDEKGGTPIVGATIEKSYYYGEKIATPNPNPTKGKLLFDGWYNGTNKWKFSTDTVTTNTDLIAKYYATVKFDKNGAVGTTTPTDLSKVYEGSKISAPTNGLTKTGYDFEGWYYKTSGDKYAKWDFNTAIASNTELTNGVLTLYAGWTQVKPEMTEEAGTIKPVAAGDVKANFTVPQSDYEKLLTKEEQAAIENEGNSYKLILNVVTPNASATDVAKELTQLGVKRGKNEILAFQADISLTKVEYNVVGQATETDIKDANVPITVTINVPNGVWATLINDVPIGYRRTIYVNRAHTNNTGDVQVTSLGAATINTTNQTLSFTTNQFSVYEITYVDVKVNHPHAHYIVNSVKTGDSGVLLYGVLAVSSLMGMGYFRSRREDEM